ncbi:hypothetical protein [uncultured Deinococcus sp.]|uniref:hypothetical protein n=1 Tax=uncultured Deinococcus sp. TaxID=158789 RepID=UPI00258A4391|nr:hypothetical protein [uncultured Deinococcus sp.]
MDIPQFPIGTATGILGRLLRKPMQQLLNWTLRPITKVFVASDIVHQQHMLTDCWQKLDENIEFSLHIPTDFCRDRYDHHAELKIKSSIPLKRISLQIRVKTNLKDETYEIVNLGVLTNLKEGRIYKFGASELTAVMQFHRGLAFTNYDSYQVVAFDIDGELEKYGSSQQIESSQYHPTYSGSIGVFFKDGDWGVFNGRLYNTLNIRIAKINFEHRLSFYTYPLVMGVTEESTVQNGFSRLQNNIFNYLSNHKRLRNTIFWIMLYRGLAEITPEGEFKTKYDDALEQRRRKRFSSSSMT